MIAYVAHNGHQQVRPGGLMSMTRRELVLFAEALSEEMSRAKG